MESYDRHPAASAPAMGAGEHRGAPVVWTRGPARPTDGHAPMGGATPGSAVLAAAKDAWRPGSVPERLAMVGVGLVPAVALYPTAASATGVTLFCPLRAATGIPCPLCGGTTAALHLAGGRIGEALTANPLVPVLAVFLAAMTVVVLLRSTGRLAPARRWSPLALRMATALVAGAALASWIFQLHRFGWL